MVFFKIIFRCLLFVVMTFVYTLNIKAQVVSDNYQINGVVKDSVSGDGISYVTISVQNEQGVVKCLASDLSGQFDFHLNLTGEVDIIFHSVGYQLQKNSITLEGENSKIAMGTILLSQVNEEIEEVTVIAQKPLVRIEIDKLIYSFEADPESKTSTVMEMLRKVPLLSVDGEDNIQLRGSSNFKILINGKSSSMLSQNYKDVLRSMPASSIRDIEVITDPSSKYEAEGTAGIINMITDRKRSDGYKVRLSTGVDTYGGVRGSLFSTTKINKFGFSINYNLGKWKRPQSESFACRENFLSTSNRFSESEGTNKNKGIYNYFTGEASYEIDTLNLISLAFTGYYGKWEGTGIIMSMDFDQNKNVTRQFENVRSGSTNYGWLSGNIDYQHTFKKPDKTFTVSYKLENFTRDIESHNEILGILNYNSYKQKTYNNPTGREHTIQLDYFNPLSKIHQIESGLKYILRQNISNSEVFRFDSTRNDWVLDVSRINDLDYNQHIFGLYGGYTRKGEKITLKIGLRFEGTINDGIFKSVKDTSFTNKMFNLIPYIALSKKLEKDQTVKLSYTQRIRRPGIWYLNPFYNDTDPLNVRYGNPGLDAEVSHTFDFTYGKFSDKINFNMSVNSAFTNNAIQSISTMSADGVRSTTYDNIGKNQRYGINIYGSAKIGKKINMNTNLAMYYSILESNDNRNLNNEGINYNSSLNIRYNAWKEGTFSGYVGIYSSRVGLQTSSSLWVGHNFSFTQNFFQKKMSISLSVNSPFKKKMKWERTFDDPTFIQTNTNYYYSRRFRINISYSFGQLQDGVKKVKRGIKNEDVKSGDSGTGAGTGN